MNILSAIYQYLFYLPLSYLFHLLVGIFKNYFLAIIFLTLILKIIIFPLTRKNIRVQKNMQRIQEEIRKIEEKYKTNPQKKAEEVLSLYKREGVSFFNILLVFLQIPVFFTLYQIFLKETKEKNSYFISANIQLTEPNYFFALFAFFLQIFYLNLVSKIKKQPLSEKIWQNLPFLLTFFIFLKLPAVILFYWIFFNLLSIIEYRLFYAREK